MWYKNIAGRFFGLVTKHACDGRTDGQNYDSQDSASIARAVKMGQRNKTHQRVWIANAVYTALRPLGEFTYLMLTVYRGLLNLGPTASHEYLLMTSMTGRGIRERDDDAAQ